MGRRPSSDCLGRDETRFEASSLNAITVDDTVDDDSHEESEQRFPKLCSLSMSVLGNFGFREPSETEPSPAVHVTSADSSLCTDFKLRQVL